MASMQAPTGTSKSAKFQHVSPLGPMVDPFSGLEGEQNIYQQDLLKSVDERLMGSSQRTRGNPGETTSYSQGFAGGHYAVNHPSRCHDSQVQLCEPNQHIQKHDFPRQTACNTTNQQDDDQDSIHSDDEWLDQLDSDPAIMALREERIEQMRKQQMQYNSRGHGEYRTISQDEFLPETCAAATNGTRTNSEWVVVHFFQDEFLKCQIMDHHLKIIAEQHLECKFLRIQASKAPFFCAKLKIQTLPTVLILREGKVVDRIVGFEGIVSEDSNEWPTSLLRKRLCKSGAIQYNIPQEYCGEEVNEDVGRRGVLFGKGSIRRGGAVRHYDDEDD